MFGLLKELWRFRGLLQALVKRDFTGKYMGSLGGAVWVFIQPVLLFAVYLLVFSVILKTRWQGLSNTTDYAFMLYCGLLVYNAFSQCLEKSATLIAGNPHLVKKVCFPLELLPFVTVVTASLQVTVACAVWLAGYYVVFGYIHASVVLVPLIWLCFIPWLLGVGWLISALGVFVKDIAYLTGLLSHAALFLSPVFYSLSQAPEALRGVLVFNPLTIIVEAFRDILFYGRLPDMHGLACYFILTGMFAWLSFMLFSRLRPMFADLV